MWLVYCKDTVCENLLGPLVSLGITVQHTNDNTFPYLTSQRHRQYGHIRDAGDLEKDELWSTSLGPQTVCFLIDANPAQYNKGVQIA